MSELNKRKANDEGALVLKKQKTDGEKGALVASSSSAGAGGLPPNLIRTSNLQYPIVQLQGHQAEVFTARFSPSGKNLASGSLDKSICKSLKSE
jgi:Prp8 binding protein